MTLGDGRDVTVTGQSMLRWEGLAFGCGAQVDRHEFSWMHIAHIVTAYKFGSPEHGCCRRFRSTPHGYDAAL